jgi:hypothetical protein
LVPGTHAMPRPFSWAGLPAAQTESTQIKEPLIQFSEHA